MKNKEIEELLNDIKFEYNNKEKWITDMALSEDAWGLLLSYIEQLEKDKQVLIRNNNIGNERLKELQNINKQLETDYKEANDSVTWWTNRYNAIVKQNDDNHKKVVKLENNIDKAIKYIEIELSQGGERELRDLVDGYEVLNILKGDSDDK